MGPENRIWVEMAQAPNRGTPDATGRLRTRFGTSGGVLSEGRTRWIQNLADKALAKAEDKVPKASRPRAARDGAKIPGPEGPRRSLTELEGTVYFDFDRNSELETVFFSFGFILATSARRRGQHEVPEEDFLSFFSGGLAEGAGSGFLMHFEDNSDIDFREDYCVG